MDNNSFIMLFLPPQLLLQMASDEAMLGVAFVAVICFCSWAADWGRAANFQAFAAARDANDAETMLRILQEDGHGIRRVVESNLRLDDSLQFVELVLESFQDPHYPHWSPPLWRKVAAVRTGDDRLPNAIAMMKLLLRYNADTDRVELLRWVGSKEMANLLLDAVPSSDRSKLLATHCGGRSSLTPLHFAAAEGRRDIVELFLHHGADVTALDNSNETPLHLAAYNGHLDVAALLLLHGAEVNARDYAGRTPLHHAAQSGSSAIAALLLEHGASETLLGQVEGVELTAAELARRRHKDPDPKSSWAVEAVSAGYSKVLAKLWLSTHGDLALFAAVKQQKVRLVVPLLELDAKLAAIPSALASAEGDPAAAAAATAADAAADATAAAAADVTAITATTAADSTVDAAIWSRVRATVELHALFASLDLLPHLAGFLAEGIDVPSLAFVPTDSLRQLIPQPGALTRLLAHLGRKQTV